MGTRLLLTLTGGLVTAALAFAQEAPKDAIVRADALLADGRIDGARAALSAIDDTALDDAMVEVLARSAVRIGDALRQSNQMTEALEIYERALALRERRFSGDHPDVAASLHSVAYCLSALGRRVEALPKYEEVLAIRQRLFPSDHPDVALSINNVASCLTALGRSAEALPKFVEVLALRRHRFPGDDSNVALSLSNVALCHHAMGNSREALPILEEALAMRRRLFPGDHLDVAMSLNGVATCLQVLGRSDEALPRVQEASAMLRRVFSGDHLATAESIDGVAVCLQALGRSDEALQQYEEALAMRRRLFSGQHPSVAWSLNNVGYCLHVLGRSVEALPRLEEGLFIRKRLFPGDHPEVAASLNNVALCLQARGRAVEALARFEEALAMRRRLFQGDHPGVAGGLYNVGCCLRELGRSSEALLTFEAALAMRRRIFLDDHPDVAWSLDSLAACSYALGRSKEALPRFAEALEMRRRLFPGDHPDVATSLASVALCFDALGRSAEGLSLEQEALAMRLRLFPYDHPDVASSHSSVASSLYALGRGVEALPKLEAALAMRQRLFPAEHPDVATSLVALAQCRLEVEKDAAGSASLLKDAVRRIEALRSSARAFPDADLTAYFRQLRRVDPYALLCRVEVDLGNPLDALATAERGRSRSLNDLLSRSGFDPLDEAERQARIEGDERAEATINRVRQDLEHADGEVDCRFHEIVKLASDRGLDEATRAASKAALDAELRAASDDRQQLVRERARIIADVVTMAEPVAPERVQAVLDPNDLLLVFALDVTQSHVFVVDRETVEALPIPGNLEVVSRLVAAARTSIELGADPGRGVAALVPAARATQDGRGSLALRDALFPPSVLERVRHARRLLLIPDGALHRFPLEALVIGMSEGGSPRYWLDELPPIAYAPSQSALVELHARTEQHKDLPAPLDLLAVGDALFGTGPGDLELSECGALIARIATDSQADRLGLRPLDVIVEYDGMPIPDDQAFRDAAEAVAEAIGHGARDRIPIELKILRGGETSEHTVEPGELGVILGRGTAGEAYDLGYGRDPDDWAKASLRDGFIDRFGGLKPLPGTRVEVKAIAGMFDQDCVESLLGPDASEGRVFELAPKARFLHFATHGLFDEVSGQSLSALALTLPAQATRSDDGFLKLTDLLGSWQGRLASCDMVVLSACETQVGVEQLDEAPQALSIGFLSAGASSVVASLWKVEDESTAALMTEFYRGLGPTGEKQDRLEALVKAKKLVKARYPSPFHWAPFVYVGSPQ